MLKLHTIETLVYAKNLIYFWAHRRRHRPKDLCGDRTAALRHKWWRGTCWRELGPKLDIPAAKIPQNLDEDFRCNRDKAIALLLMWKQKEREKCSGRVSSGCFIKNLEKTHSRKASWQVGIPGKMSEWSEKSTEMRIQLTSYPIAKFM